MSTVITQTLHHNLCIGCGICAGICPKHTLAMQWNKFGEYNPVKINDCGKECGLCLKVCPFQNGNKNEDALGNDLFSSIPDIRHRMETGYYLTSGVGGVSSEADRYKSASGGLATWFLRQLLKNNIIDGVVCAVKTGDPDKLFRFTIAKTDEEISSAAGSVYYPLELSEVTTYILEHSGRYAIIALPCFIKALRLAQNKNGLLHKRILITASLTCGRQPTAHFAKYIGYCSGLNEDIAYLHFRTKSKNASASYLTATTTTTSGKKSSVGWNEHNFWGSGYAYFSYNACNYCDDVFGECADVTFMDAWLPEYSQKPEGTSLWIARSTLASEILHKGIQSGELNASAIPIEKIIQSQTPNGLIKKKKQTLDYRLQLLKREHPSTPEKRTQNAAVSFIDRLVWKKDQWILKTARRNLIQTNYNYEYMETWFKKIAGVTLPLRCLGYAEMKIRQKLLHK